MRYDHLYESPYQHLAERSSRLRLRRNAGAGPPLPRCFNNVFAKVFIKMFVNGVRNGVRKCVRKNVRKQTIFIV